ncbi:MAG TPA: MFS transporter [Archangium sp.]|nr:MFS transporter [Archangium sp.]
MSDRFDRRSYLLTIVWVQILVSALLTSLAFRGQLSMPVLLMLLVGIGCSATMMWPAFNAQEGHHRHGVKQVDRLLSNTGVDVCEAVVALDWTDFDDDDHTLFRQGCMYYQALPDMPEVQLRPLLERFAQLVCEQLVFREAFGLL